MNLGAASLGGSDFGCHEIVVKLSAGAVVFSGLYWVCFQPHWCGSWQASVSLWLLATEFSSLPHGFFHRALHNLAALFKLSDLREGSQHPRLGWSWKWYIITSPACYWSYKSVLVYCGRVWIPTQGYEYQEVGITGAILEASYRSGSITVYIFCDNLGFWRSKLIRATFDGNFA